MNVGRREVARRISGEPLPERATKTVLTRFLFVTKKRFWYRFEGQKIFYPPQENKGL